MTVEPAQIPRPRPRNEDPSGAGTGEHFALPQRARPLKIDALFDDVVRQRTNSNS
jgi:hypothetical protein